MEDSGDLRERTIVIHEIVSDANDVEFTRELADDRNALLWFRHLQDAFMLAVANCADDSIYRINAPQQNPNRGGWRSEEHTSELQSLMRISYAVFCLKKKT